MDNAVVVLDDVQKLIDEYIAYPNSEDGLKKLVRFITQIFISEDKGFEVSNDDGKLQEIAASVCKLNETDIEKAYHYTVRKVNDPELEIYWLLRYLPDDKTTAFTRKINKYLKNKRALASKAFIDFIEDRNEDVMLRFKAFYILFTYHHDQKDISKNKRIVETYRDDFSIFPLWYYTNSQILYQEERNKNKADMSEALASAKKCIDIYNTDKRYDPNYPGIYHNFCELVFYASELGDKESFEDNYELAGEYIEKAKSLNPKFAKYYYTEGRLLMAKCRYVSPEEAGRLYDKAEKLFNRAIDMEDSSREDYAIKIVDYETALLRCKTERRLKEIDVALKEAKDNQEKTVEIQKQTQALVQDSKTLKEELEEQKKGTLELLGFFSGIISLIVVTSQVVLNLDMISACVVMLLFLGTLIMAFSFFHFIILNGARKTIQSSEKDNARENARASANTRAMVLFMLFAVILIIGAIVIAAVIG